MTGNEYQRLAAGTINESLTTIEQELHAMHGMSAEVGELHSLYQKAYQGHTMNEEHAKKEVGDILWMIAEYCTANGWSLDDIMWLNIDKLRFRYPEGFDAEHSLADCIDRQTAIDALEEQIKQCDKAIGSFGISMKDEYAVKVEKASLMAFKETLENIPDADVVPVVHARWEKKKDSDLFYCSECGLPSMHKWPYCERCGAKMDGEREEK